MKIVVVDGHAVSSVDLSFEQLAPLGELVVYDYTDRSELESRIKDADVVVTNKVFIDAEIMDKCPRLKLVAVAATGYNIVDCKAAKEKGIAVTNIPAYSTDSVAQMVFAFLLNVTNRVQYYTDENRRGRWASSPDFCYTDFTHHELANKTLGIVGMGNIGLKVALIANAFGMKVMAVTHRPQTDLPAYIKKADLDELLETSDVISLHCPLTEENKCFINAGTIARMKKGIILINTGRGALINETDVAVALKSGRISAFCADVLSQEPPKDGNPLFESPNVYTTPHIAWATLEARQRLCNILFNNIQGFRDGHPINVVN